MNIKEFMKQKKEEGLSDKRSQMELGKMVTNKMNEMFDAGFTKQEIAKELGIPEESIIIGIKIEKN